MNAVVELNSRYKMPKIGLGTWLSAPGQVYDIVKYAIKHGYRHIDCAALYGNEKEIGRALSESLEEGVVERSELFITSKLWNNAHRRDDVFPALQETLNDLQLNYLDLYLIHWPVAFEKGVIFPSQASDYIALDKLPIIETYGAMELAVDEGLIKSIGVSNFSQHKLEGLIEEAKIMPAVNQVELHPYLQQQDLVKYCQSTGVVLTGYSPLGSTGRPAEFCEKNEPSLLIDQTIIQMAEKYQVTPAQILIAWGLSRNTVMIPKTVTPNRVLENLAALDVTLDLEDIEKITRLDKHYRFIDASIFATKGSPYSINSIWDE